MRVEQRRIEVTTDAVIPRLPETAVSPQ